MRLAEFGRNREEIMIEAINLTKRYEDGHLALDAVNLRVKAGEVYCLLGANDAGKTTTINLFLNFIRPTSGFAIINGIDATIDPIEAKKHVSYVPENVTLYGHFTARQNLALFARLGGLRKLKKDDYYRVLREVGLQERAFEQRVSEFSKGMRQKVGIAIALIRNSPALLLDEPTSGLDPKALAEFTEIIQELRERNRAVLMSTHDVFLAKRIANRVGIMKEGRKVMERTSDELKHEDLQAIYLNYMGGGYRTDDRPIAAN
jgi:ABC-2 type transport system ATP-binding protein